MSEELQVLRSQRWFFISFFKINFLIKKKNLKKQTKDKA